MVESSALAYTLARVGEGFLYNDAVADMHGDVEHLQQVQRILLGTPS
ncbi:hypothetical protein ACIHDR_45820 [Nocardia sp. NPDC052278]